ncbi:MAG: VWA domain-containing protein [Bryobacteraceae bacterium]
MRGIASGVLALAGLLAMPPPASSQTVVRQRVTVRELEALLTSARTSLLRDDDIAEEIGRVEPTERITEATLESLSRDQGKDTKLALRILAEESAFLDPPAAELPAGGPPAVEEQKAIVEKAFDYARGYIGNLPNFRCMQVVRRFEGDPSPVHARQAVNLGHLHLRDAMVSDLAFENGKESQQVRSVNGAPWNRKTPLGGLTTYGEFGAILAAPFGVGKAKWSHWETMDGKRVAVFTYSVDRAHSNYSLNWCCTAWMKRERRETVATEGALFIEPATGAIFRVTRQAVGISAGFPMRRCDTAVEYRRVDIGGQAWICPIRSITISDNLKPDQPTHLGAYDGPGNARYHTYELNEVAYTDYHKFEAESRLLADDVPQEENKAGAGPAEAQPVAPAPAAAPPPQPQTHEDRPVTFQSKVNLVLVPVVVRDLDGHAVADLRKEAFTLFDNGKRREIESFEVERAGHIVAVDRPALGTNAPSEAGHGEKAASAPMDVPDHFIAYLFDDMGLTSLEDLVRVRDGAMRHIDELSPGDRAAVFTTSCRTTLDFTDDREKLRQAVSRIQFKPLGSLCSVPLAPPLDGASGDRGPTLREGAQFVKVNGIRGVVQRMSDLPGERSIIFISYGLVERPWILEELTGYVQRNRVVVHTLNAQGIRPITPGANAAADRRLAEFSESEVSYRHMSTQGMLELARATGGAYVAPQDARAAFRKLATPEWVYMLGITPGEAVVDKKTHVVKAHELKVKLTDPRKLSLQARGSYYPPAPAGQ